MIVGRTTVTLLLGIYLTFVSLQMPFTEGHPLCMDSTQPFVPGALREPEVCTRYINYTCCQPEDELQIQKHITKALNRLTPEKKALCEKSVRDILCLRCSPYFSHTYDYEAFRRAEFPGLCTNFCLEFYNDCLDAIKEMTTNNDILESLESDERFCGKLNLTGSKYCYPDVIPLNEKVLGESRPITQKTDSCICFEEFASGLRNPVIFRTFPDDSGRILVGEQRGVVYLYHWNATREKEPFLDLQDGVVISNKREEERGFLALAFHPNFTVNHRLFLYLTASVNSEDVTLLQEYSTDSKNDQKIDYSSVKTILMIPQPQPNHNGGELFFGFDGYLYLSTGDGGGQGDPDNSAQNKSVLLGKMLRIDVDHIPDGKTYGIPRDNPYISEINTRPEIYALGLRNPWRCDLDEGDPLTGYGRGRIICGDVGQDKWEEVNIIKKGKNYGWSAREGLECFKQNLCDDILAEELPIHVYSHEVGQSIIGGKIYRGCHSPDLNGKYIYSDYNHGSIFRLTEDRATGHWYNGQILPCPSHVCGDAFVSHYEQHVLSFGEDINGEVYILTSANPISDQPVGSIYRIVDPHRSGDLRKCKNSDSDDSVRGSGSMVLPFGRLIQLLYLILYGYLG